MYIKGERVTERIGALKNQIGNLCVEPQAMEGLNEYFSYVFTAEKVMKAK